MSQLEAMVEVMVDTTRANVEVVAVAGTMLVEAPTTITTAAAVVATTTATTTNLVPMATK